MADDPGATHEPAAHRTLNLDPAVDFSPTPLVQRFANRLHPDPMSVPVEFEDDDIEYVPVPMDRATRTWLALQEGRPGVHQPCKSDIGLKAANVITLVRHDDEQHHSGVH